jgi:hypothetical protein
MNSTPALDERLDGIVEVEGAQRHVLDALALVLLQVFLDLAGLARILVDGDADLAVGLVMARNAGPSACPRCRSTGSGGS